jgi:hypothetical protein
VAGAGSPVNALGMSKFFIAALRVLTLTTPSRLVIDVAVAS